MATTEEEGTTIIQEVDITVEAVVVVDDAVVACKICSCAFAATSCVAPTARTFRAAPAAAVVESTWEGIWCNSNRLIGALLSK